MLTATIVEGLSVPLKSRNWILSFVLADTQTVISLQRNKKIQNKSYYKRSPVLIVLTSTPTQK